MNKNVTIHLNDKVEIRDIATLPNTLLKKLDSGKPKKTRIVLTNHDTGEVLGEFENKVVITGSLLNAMKAFGITEHIVEFPTYNSESELDNSVPTGTQPENPEIVQLFCVADSGCGVLPSEIYTTKFTDRLKPCPAHPIDITDFDPTMIMPFRYVPVDEDISDDLRNYYFGRKTFENLGTIGYYFKKFDTEPQVHVQYADGTQITDNIYVVDADQTAECYIETRLRITRLDFSDYFEKVLGWDRSRISSISLCSAWYNTVDDKIYFQNIIPYTVLKFSFQWLTDLNVAIDILYQIYY